MQVSLLWQGVDPAVMGELYCFLLPQPGWNFLELPFWFGVHSFLSLFKKSVYKFFCLIEKDTNENVPNSPTALRQLVQHPVSQWS